MATQLALSTGRRFAAWSAQVRDDGVQAGARTVTFAISTEDKARDGHIIRANGWDLAAYRKNPVVLWAHDHGQPPIGRSKAEWVDAKRLMSTCEFTPRDLNPLGASVGEMYARGFMNAVSVGFDVKRYEAMDAANPWSSWDIKEAELYEYSGVPIPADANALVTARAHGIDMTPIRQWVERALDSGLAPREALERAYLAVTDRPVAVGLDEARVRKIVREEMAAESEPDGDEDQIGQFFEDGDGDDRDGESDEEMAADDEIEIT